AGRDRMLFRGIVQIRDRSHYSFRLDFAAFGMGEPSLSNLSLDRDLCPPVIGARGYCDRLFERGQFRQFVAGLSNVRAPRRAYCASEVNVRLSPLELFQRREVSDVVRQLQRRSFAPPSSLKHEPSRYG